MHICRRDEISQDISHNHETMNHHPTEWPRIQHKEHIPSNEAIKKHHYPTKRMMGRWRVV